MIRDLGNIFSVQTKAQTMANEIEQLQRTYRPLVHDALILIWRAPYMTFNADTYANAASRLFGFQNAFARHSQRYPSLTGKEIEQSNPAVVLFPDEPYPFQSKHLEQFKTEFPGLSAVEKNRLLPFDGSYIAWHGYGTLRALREFPSILSEKLQ
jgi:ABC-type Fe3+-hydroxamate transport system substrate-binding protein